MVLGCCFRGVFWKVFRDVFCMLHCGFWGSKWSLKVRNRLPGTLSGNACDSASPRAPFLEVLTSIRKGWGRLPSGRELTFQENPNVDPDYYFASILYPGKPRESVLYAENVNLNCKVFCYPIRHEILCKMTPQSTSQIMKNPALGASEP